MNKRVLEEARRFIEEIQKGDPAIVERILSRLSPEAHLVKYVLGCNVRVLCEFNCGCEVVVSKSSNDPGELEGFWRL